MCRQFNSVPAHFGQSEQSALAFFYYYTTHILTHLSSLKESQTELQKSHEKSQNLKNETPSHIHVTHIILHLR